jgi:hypothetical protein
MTCDFPRGRASVALDARDGLMRVVLREPSMPLAWAVDLAAEGPFRGTWHAERSGGRADSLPAYADVEIPREPIRVHAWGDDGTLFETKSERYNGAR